MRTWTKTAGLLFLAAAAVYSDPVRLAGQAAAAKAVARETLPAPEVTALADAPAAEPVADAGTSAPTEASPSAPAPSQGQSLSGSQVNVTEAGTVEIHVNDANINEVLRMLSLQLEKNILPSKEVRGTVTANLYDVTVKEAMDAILRSNGFDYREKGNVIYVYSAKEIADMDKKNRVTRTQLFRLFYTPAGDAANMIKPVLSSEAQVSFTAPAKSGIESDSSDVGGNSHATEDVIVVTDYPEKLEQVARVIKEIDKRPQQILVEAVIMRATLQDDNALGVDFTAVGGVDFNNLSGVGSEGSGSGLDQSLNGQIIENADAADVNDDGFGAISLGGKGLKLGLVKNNIGVFINALEGVTDTVVMANPKVLVLNKQKGEVHVGSEQGYRTAITTETATADDVKFLETGTRLIFRPYIGDNGNIRMEIKPEDSSGSVNAAGLPNKFVTQVTTNVMVRDGHTIVIGGLFRESNSIAKSQVPGLGSLPGVGALFGQRTDATVREEVIILLTPHIVKDDEAYSAASEEEMKAADQMRIGMRKGMMPWGRERLAESSYDKAVEEMNKPNPNRKKALWYLDCANNLNPKFTEAIALKARITGQEASSVDNSTIRTFLSRQIMAEKAKGVPAYPSTEPLLLPEEKVVEPEPAATPASAAAIDAAPATQPVAEAVSAEAPAPVTEAVEPEFADAVVEEAFVAEEPATQPSTDFSADFPATQPSEVAVEESFAPETQLVESAEGSVETTVTELPAD